MMICKHYSECGGCAVQGLSEEDERLRKITAFNKAMPSEVHINVHEFFQAPLYSRRRVSLTSKRTKKMVQVGFLQKNTHHLVSIDECMVITKGLLALKNFITEITPEIGSRSAQLKFHITECLHGFDIVIENSKEVQAETRTKIAQLCSHYKINRLIIGTELIYQECEPIVEMAGQNILIPPHPFLQASKECENQLRAWVNEALSPCGSVVDLFAGLGTFSYALKSQVSAYEGEKSLVKQMKANLDRLQLHHISVHLRDLFRDPLTAKELARFDGAVIDPPRAGAKAQCQTLSTSPVKRIAYVSCDTNSFARDAQILQAGGFHIDFVHLMDQFRFSNHLELFALFSKNT